MKKKVNLKLHKYYKSNKVLFDNVWLWIIKYWGGIVTAKDSDTLKLVIDFLDAVFPICERTCKCIKQQHR